MMFIIFIISISLPCFSSKADNILLSRLEVEWLGKTYENNTDETRLDVLEEKVFGTSFEDNINNRLERLKKAFNAKKKMQLRHKSFKGVPTGISNNIDYLYEK